jgi:maltose/moltooligosaccharide transporter
MERKVNEKSVDTTKITDQTAKKKTITNSLPSLPLSTIFAMTFGFFGVNMAFSLQSSQMGRIFQTIGADPTKLGFFFILPPLAGMVVQPLVGKYSDLTWSEKFGRRMPYLMLGAPIAAIVMALLPNAGSFGFGYASLAALTFGAIAILFMDLSSNVCMQPFKMIIGDMVNEDQKDLAWSWQQSFSNLGGVVATVFPFLLTMVGIPNVAKQGVVPLSVRLSFYIGAAILLATSIYTIIKVKNMIRQLMQPIIILIPNIIRLLLRCGNWLKKHHVRFGKFHLFNCLIGLHFSIYGLMQLEQLLKMFGILPTQHQQAIKRLEIGMEF